MALGRIGAASQRLLTVNNSHQRTVGESQLDSPYRP